MPRQTLKGVIDATQALKDAQKAHDDARNYLLKVILRVMRDLNDKVPDYAEKIGNHRGQMLLGAHFQTVIQCSQDTTGVTLPPDEAAKFSPNSIALDLAMALNNEGTEVVYKPTSSIGLTIREVSLWSNIPASQFVPWLQIGEYSRLMMMFASIPKIKDSGLRLTPETTINEIALAINGSIRAS